MIKRIFFIFVLFLNFISCSKKETPVIVIDNIRISKEEFEEEFKKYNREVTKENINEFLENFINRKLVLKEAERLNIDKEKEFLKDLQNYWEQSLLKIVLDRKSKELFLSIKITDEEINNFYDKNKEKFYNKDLKDVYSEIKFIITKEKQKQVLSNWIESLRKKSNIKINYKLLWLE